MGNLKQASISKSRSYTACLSEAHRMLFDNIRSIFSRTPLAVHPRHALRQHHVAYGGAMRRIAYNALCGNRLLCKSNVRSQRAANEVEHQEMYNPCGMLYCVLRCHCLCLRSRFLWGDDG